ncbi:tetratricopeptide repeat protein [Streptomyces sp. NBC_01142]|uniref:tetratricopeptide repeat protein n=1 Tax=Streptomyces sp. NBC_01142 TaxID=2975865 RepID=UPI00225782E1|nr:tetratricopeptide repeat protein [Streptomyces sp. NBC_01142]MCX4826090.1 tetratricopeptide repeat protein [Streptomyces sp. NBC_01142]
MTAAQQARENFAAQLKGVLRDAGSPSYEALVRHSGRKLSTTRIGNVLNAEFTKPVAWEFIDAFLTACDQYAKDNRIALSRALYDRELWGRRHTVLTGVLELLGEEQAAAAPAAFVVEPFPRPSRQAAPAWRDQPSQLLSAQHQVVPFIGREGDLARLEDWRDGDGPVAAVTLLYAPGGRGKTRLAARLAETTGTGWKVWQAVRGSTSTAGTAARTLPALGRRALLVIDYAERWPKQDLQTLLQTLAARPGERLRVLLLARSGGTWWTSRQHDLRKLNYLPSTVELLPLSGRRMAARKEAFIAARDRFAAALGLTDPETVPCPGNLADEAFSLTLTIHMAALVAVDAHLRGAAPPNDPVSLSQYLLERERDYWDKLHDHSADVEIGPEVMAQAVYTATLTRPVDYDTALEALTHARVDTPATLTTGRVLSDHAVCYPPLAPNAFDAPATYLEPLYPDRLGEDFLALTTPGYPPRQHLSTGWADKAPAHLLAAATADPAPALPWTRDTLTILINTAERWPHIATRQLYPLLKNHPELSLHAGGTALATLAGLDTIDLTVLEAIEPHLPIGRHTDLDVGVAAIASRLARHRLATTYDPATRARILETLAVRQSYAGLRNEALPVGQDALQAWRDLTRTNPAHQPDLAASLSNLGVTLSAVGRREEALTAAQEAVDVYRRLAADNPAAYEPNLATSLSNLGADLSAVGRREKALTATEEAVDVSRRLAAGNPAAYEPDLATSLTNLGVRLSEVGRREEALTAAQEAVDVYRRLAADNPAAYEPNLATSLSNLGADLSAVGRREKALTTTQEAVEIRRRLAAGNPAAYEPDLAGSLTNLGVRLSEVGRREEALTAAQEAVDVYRRLAADNPAAYEPNLATSLSNLGADLSAVGRREEALTAAQEAVEIRRRLVAGNPAANEPDLAGSLTNLGADLSAVGRREKALTATEEAVDVYRRLAADNPAAYEPNLATSLSNLGIRLSEVGRREEALTAAQEAVEIRRRLAAGNPAANEPDLAGSLSNLGALLSAVERCKEALTAAQEAVDVYRRLAADNPAANEPDLARSLTVWAWVRYEAKQDPSGALRATGEAVEIYRRLVTAAPAQFLSPLRSVLGLQADLLLRLGRVREARDIRTWLAANPCPVCP